MSSIPQKPEAWIDDVDDDLHEQELSGAVVNPPISELEAEAIEIEETLARVEKTPTQPEFPGYDDCEKLVNEMSLGENFGKEGKGKKPLVKQPERPSTSDSKSSDVYQESFTSQEETAQIRNHIESLDSRLLSIEAMLASVMAERKELPSHLNRHREEINKQFTLISDRLYTALEQNIDQNAVAQTAKDVSILTADSSHVLSTLSSDLSREPNPHSDTSRPVPITRKPKRVRVIE